MAFRTQKISQMTPKGANLEATDLIEVSTIESGSYVTRSITGQEIIDAAVGNVDWGDIGGTLSAQTDLQSALDAKVPTSRTLTINGVTQDLSANRTFTISTGITIGSTAIASGVVGRVLFEGAGNVVQESANLFWDATNNRLGIGTSTPAYALEISSASGSQTAGILVKNTGGGSSDYSSFNLLNNNNILAQVFNTSSGYAISPVIGANGFGHYTNGSGGITLWADGGVIKFITGTGANAFGSQKMTLATTGNLLINTATDAGFRLDVNGDVRLGGKTFTGTATILVPSQAHSVSDIVMKGDSALISANGNANQWGKIILCDSGAATTYQNYGVGHFFKIGTTSPITYLTITSNNITTGASTRITMGAQDASDIYQSTSANLYGSFLLFGNTGNTIFKNSYTSGSYQFFTAPSVNGTIVKQLQIFSSGNILLQNGGTFTDAGFRLDVNGTARVKGTGTTSGTTAFTVQSSNGNNSLKVRDDNKVAFGNSSVDCTITGTAGSGNKFEFYAFNGYDVIDGFGNVLVTGLGDTIRLPRDVGIGFNTQNNASARLQVDSTTKGFLPPRMTTTQKNAIASPAAGLMVYDTTLNVISYYNGTMWI